MPSRGEWTAQTLQNCIKAVTQHGLSVRQASKRFGVPRQTLRNYMKSGSVEKRLSRKPLLCVDKLVYLALWTNCF